MIRVLDTADGRLNNHRMLRGIQIRLSRLAVGWSQAELADRAHLSIATIQRAEGAEDGPPRITYSNMLAIRRALEDAGISFIEDEANPGIRWRMIP